MAAAATPQTAGDPFAVLGLPATASEEVVRARYLELVRQFSPESDPERFQQIHRAYEAASDPLLVAKSLMREMPVIETWKSILDRQRANPPRIATEVLLSLGNEQAELSK